LPRRTQAQPAAVVGSSRAIAPWREEMTDSYRVPDSTCTNCGKENDLAAHPLPDHRPPQANDWAVCFYCRHLMVYGNDLRLRNLTDEEAIEVAGDPEIILAMKMLAEYDNEEGQNAAQTPPGNRAHRRAHRSR
jgi:hypothetical protein